MIISFISYFVPSKFIFFKIKMLLKKTKLTNENYKTQKNDLLVVENNYIYEKAIMLRGKMKFSFIVVCMDI